MESVNNKTVLLTGGRGFLGRAAKEMLGRAGYSVVSLDVKPLSAAENRYREVVCDIRERAPLRMIFEGVRPAGVVHLAAMLPTAAERDPAQATEVNVVGSVNLIEMAREFGVRFVFGSSLSVYGTCPEDQNVSETDAASPEDVYGAAKLYVERVGAAYRDRGALDFVSLRIGRVVGPGAESTTSAWRSEIFESLIENRAGEITIPYAERERIMVVHVDDVARMLVKLVSAPRFEHVIYNAPCESIVVGDLKSVVEGLNRNVRINLGGEAVVGNPRRLDFSRFDGEFDLQASPVFERLKAAARL